MSEFQTERFKFKVWGWKEGEWSVYLPHQCEAWEIIGYTPESGGFGETEGTLQKAHDDMAEFVAEATTVLEWLRGRLRERTEADRVVSP